MTEIRSRPELAGLFPGPGAATPLPADLDGTVALLAVSRYRRDVILVDRAGARAYELTGLDLGTLADHVGNYFAALATLVDPDATMTGRRAGEAALRDLLRWLGDAVAATVLSQVPPGSRVWWCPTGPLTYLPLHAADQVPDRVISSYTPTLAALTRARRVPPPAEQRVLGVAVPKAPGLPPLPGVLAELDQLDAVLPAGTPLTRLEGPGADRDAVRAALREHTWAHLACHGEQNLAQPAQAALALADGRLGITEITTLPGHHAEGAYLSACQTALGGVELTDEVLHLAAALQFAGFRRVIATLWPVNDSRARAAARHIYSVIAEDGTFRPGRSAAAVRDATLALRDRFPDAPSQWAPFVHFGP
ncbi:MAG TPA: CHAT domain-containing protein [Pseudonocardiaceae bacterium]|nr:CHAT domain-containing protein [Pseudonocardiaceae bacterium]